MDHYWRLTNYLLRQMMEKKGLIILLASLGFGVVGMLAQSFPRAAKAKDITHLAESFLPYEKIVDGSGVGFVFLLGLLLLFLIIYLTANSFFTNGKGIYTILMLPISRKKIYAAFMAASLAMLFLYFAAWLVLMVVLYFPIMANYTRVAAEEVFRLQDGTVLQVLDAARDNGLYLAFRRSIFLAGCFPSSLWQLLPMFIGLLLILSSVIYGGLHVGETGGRVMVMIFGILLGGYTAVAPIMYTEQIFTEFGYLFHLLSMLSSETGLGVALLYSWFALMALVLVVRFTMKDMENKKA